MARVERRLSRLGIGRELFFVARGLGLPELMPPVVELADLEEVLEALAREDALGPGGRDAFRRQREHGARAIGVRSASGSIAHVSFVKPAEAHEVPPWLALERTWLISNAYTARASRGSGLYPRVLGAIAATAPAGHEVVLFTDGWNKPSRRGIQKAGFTPFAERWTFRAHTRWIRT